MRCAMLALALASSLFAQAAVDAQTRATPVAKGSSASAKKTARTASAAKASETQKAKKKAPTDFKAFLEEKMVEVVQRYGLSEAKARLLLKDLQATSKAAREEFAKTKEKAK